MFGQECVETIERIDKGIFKRVWKLNLPSLAAFRMQPVATWKDPGFQAVVARNFVEAAYICSFDKVSGDDSLNPVL